MKEAPMICEFCDLEIDQGCKDMQGDIRIEGWCEVCDQCIDNDYEDEYAEEVWDLPV